jgi:hypothetical protein
MSTSLIVPFIRCESKNLRFVSVAKGGTQQYFTDRAEGVCLDGQSGFPQQRN